MCRTKGLICYNLRFSSLEEELFREDSINEVLVDQAKQMFDKEKELAHASTDNLVQPVELHQSVNLRGVASLLVGGVRFIHTHGFDQSFNAVQVTFNAFAEDLCHHVDELVGQFVLEFVHEPQNLVFMDV